jgi:hypothetical protein
MNDPGIGKIEKNVPSFFKRRFDTSKPIDYNTPA